MVSLANNHSHDYLEAGLEQTKLALVLGAGPHVVRGIERYEERLIAYSLGNFAGLG